MNIAIALAAALAALTTLVHVFLGGPEIMPHIRNSDLPKPVRAVSDVVWHGVTVALAVSAVALGWLAFNSNVPLLWAVCAIQLGFACLFLWYGITQLRSIKVLPQWTVFLAVPALALFGAG